MMLDFIMSNLKIRCTKEEYLVYCSDEHEHDYIRGTLQDVSKIFERRCVNEKVSKATIMLRIGKVGGQSLVLHYNKDNKRNPYLFLFDGRTGKLYDRCSIKNLFPLLTEQIRNNVICSSKTSSLHMDFGKDDYLKNITNAIDKEYEGEEHS